jgi:hypothetical protein
MDPFGVRSIHPRSIHHRLVNTVSSSKGLFNIDQFNTVQFIISMLKKLMLLGMHAGSVVLYGGIE